MKISAKYFCLAIGP